MLDIMLLIWSLSAIVIRIWSRLTSRNRGFGWDDWFAIATLASTQLLNAFGPYNVRNLLIFNNQPFVIASEGLAIQCISYGYGLHASEIALEKLTLGLSIATPLILMGDISITLPKFSVLFFFHAFLRPAQERFASAFN